MELKRNSHRFELIFWLNSLIMKGLFLFVLTIGLHLLAHSNADSTHLEKIMVNFWGRELWFTKPVNIDRNLIETSPINQFQWLKIHLSNKKTIKLQEELESYRSKNKLDDWFYFQLLRRISQKIISKYENYSGYTLIKYFLLHQSGYDAKIFLSSNKILLYARSNDTVYNIPVKVIDQKQYVCLNYHDYDFNIDFKNEKFEMIAHEIGENRSFDYKINKMPSFPKELTVNKTIRFIYRNKKEEFTFPVNPYAREYFRNYPVIDYRYHFNIPFSEDIESSLIKALKTRLAEQSLKEGISYLMAFTRYSFDYAADRDIYGTEKRMSPEETLYAENSDCEDRSSLLFALITKIYALPVIIVSYPDHVNLGVMLEKPLGRGIWHNGKRFTICEPTPQRKDYRLGRMDKKTLNRGFEIAYAQE